MKRKLFRTWICCAAAVCFLLFRISAVTAEAGGKKKQDEQAEDVFVTLGFAGDLNLSEGWETTAELDRKKNGIRDCFSKKTIRDMRGFDIFMLNNEFTYSTRGEPSAKSFTFRADPSRVDNLKTLGVDIVLTANNHINDYGRDAFLDTLKTLDDAGIRRVGAGKNLAEAAAPVYFELCGRKIAYVAASCAEEHEDTIWTTPADEDSPGILGCYDPTAFYAAVREAAEQADFVIASVHWGYEYLEYYTAEQREMAENLVYAGADAVIGTHPHVLQGVEFVDGAPVFYSLGNFWFNGEDLMSGMAELTLRLPADPDEKVELAGTRFIPCTQYGLYTEEPENEWEREQVLQHMRDISFGTGIDADGTVTK
ncbi:MAG: CapA family protein [Eubacteriales bacterium]|nr:CapA family protein [Eubacteriales bacterium]